MKTLATAAIVTAAAVQASFAVTAFQNQVGFLTNSQKQLVIANDAATDSTAAVADSAATADSAVSVAADSAETPSADAASENEVVFMNEAGEEVLKVAIPEKSIWAPAGDSAALIDFSEITTPGTYQAFVGGKTVGHPIVVSDTAYKEMTKGALRFFYFQRSSTALEEQYAGVYARGMGHPDTAVKYHESTGILDANATKAAPKGWYDAGDYGKYIVNSGITTYTLLQLYQQNKEYFKDFSLNIPESDNDVPDILDEIRWNLEWMLDMQDTDGGVFHKLTTKQFAGMVLPEKATAQRFFIGKGIEATWNFVAVMSLASEIYAPFDSAFAKKCILAAEQGFKWGSLNPFAYFEQPKGVSTGTYTDAVLWAVREWSWAELFRATNNENLRDTLSSIHTKVKNPSLQGWNNNFFLTIFTIATNPSVFPKDMVDSAQDVVISMADNFVKSLDNNSYGVAMGIGDFYWGSNSVAANKGMVLIHAYIITKEQKYLDAAIGIVDYLVGRNPLDISFLTGFGEKSPMHPHHRPSAGDTVIAPIPGMLVGGPNASANDCKSTKVYPDAKAKSYNDNSCSYATNEVAINWNAPFAYLVGSIQAIASTGKAYDMETKPSVQHELVKNPTTRISAPKFATGSRLVFKNGAVQVEKTNLDGTKMFFDLHGKAIR